MKEIPTVTIQILGPNVDGYEGQISGLWFKLKSHPPPTEDLVVGLRVRAADGDVKQSGTIVIPKHESHSADFFYKPRRHIDTSLEIEPVDSLANLALPTVTNEGYAIEAGYVFPDYSVGHLSIIVPYQRHGPKRGLWTDKKH